MNQILIRVTEEQFEEPFSLYLSKAKHGFTSKISLYKIFNSVISGWEHSRKNGKNYIAFINKGLRVGLNKVFGKHSVNPVQTGVDRRVR